MIWHKNTGKQSLNIFCKSTSEATTGCGLHMTISHSCILAHCSMAIQMYEKSEHPIIMCSDVEIVNDSMMHSSDIPEIMLGAN